MSGPGRWSTPSRRAVELRGRQSECAQLDQLLESVQAGGSRVLVLRGDAGVGKTALLDHLAGQASGYRVARASGVQSEMELAYAGLHQLVARMLHRIDYLPGPQREALRTAFGLGPGSAPDRFLVGLAVLTLLADVAEDHPLVCLVDDQQWLDRASAQVLAFVARRLEAEPVALVFAAREPGPELAGLPELVVEGLADADARALLDSALPAPLDARVRDRIVAETRGNPLALLELPRGLTPAELGGGFGLLAAVPTSVEDSFRRRLDALPAATRTLLLVAATDPVGDPVLVWRAAGLLGVGADAAAGAVESGLIEFGARVRFRHPLVRSAAYRSATVEERQDAHRVLADATDPDADPARRAWHRAQASPQPDEAVAAELERSAGQARDRGGLAAAAAFLERAAMLTPDAAPRVGRLLAAARATRDAGALEPALRLLDAAEAGPLDGLQAAEIEHLRGQIALVRGRGADATRLLLSAARHLTPLDPAAARETHLEALGTVVWAGDPDDPEVARAAAATARAAPPGPDPPRAVDVLLDGFALRLTDGYAAAAPTLAEALRLLLELDVADDDVGRWLRLAGVRVGTMVALEVWDVEAWHTLAARQVRFARDAGALVPLQFALNSLAAAHLLTGELTAAARLLDEDRLIGEATGNPPGGFSAMTLAAWQGREPEATALVRAHTRAGNFATYAGAVLDNGLGRHDAARDAAWRAFGRDQIGVGAFVVPELAEAASRTGDEELVRDALRWLSERTRLTPSEWGLGIEARVRALLSDGDTADRLHRESIERLGRTRVRPQLARSHLLYGEWLRRRRRRVDAREQLRTAYELFDAMGMEAFAERAGRELRATGGTVGKRTVETGGELTAQEALIAGLARDGLSNPEIGTRLFLSPRTVKYHLGKVFAKLAISSRAELERVLPGGR
ncbi:MAG TPA: AAA family ATPase [Mycobacteriales bacterium]